MNRSLFTTVVAAVLLGGGAWFLFSDRAERLAGTPEQDTRSPLEAAPESDGLLRAEAEPRRTPTKRETARLTQEDRAVFNRQLAAYAQAVDAGLTAEARDRKRKSDWTKDEKQGAEQDEAMRREALAAAREPLARTLRTHQALAADLLGEIDRQKTDEVALRMARMLRYVDDPALTPELQRRATSGARPVDRQVGLIALESRPYSAWQAPLTRAFESDASSGVRDTAADILSRQIADPRYVADHKHMRATAVKALGSGDSQQRIRGLRVLMTDWTPQAFALRGRVETIHHADPSVKVQEQAGLVLRIWDQRRSKDAQRPNGGRRN